MIITEYGQDWLPTASAKNLITRAKVLNQVRHYFEQHNVLEVETPLLSASTVTDPYLEAFQFQDKYLQTSPEYAMKRLLASGIGDIYQITKAFRFDESGRYHNPEFSLLEWYRLNFSLDDMFNELDNLMRLTLDTTAIDIYRYSELFEQYLEVDVHDVELSQLQRLVDQHCPGLTTNHRDDCLTSLFATCIEPNIGQTNPCIVSHFPASQASLARVDELDIRVARRFELYYQGVELANGFHELDDPDEQAERFQEDNRKRAKSNKAVKPIDQRLLAALHSGLPNCIGVALGIDRLLMLKIQADQIGEVISFNFNNA